MAEIELSHLSRQCLDRRIDEKGIIKKEVLAWCNDQNNIMFHCCPVKNQINLVDYRSGLIVFC